MNCGGEQRLSVPTTQAVADHAGVLQPHHDLLHEATSVVMVPIAHRAGSCGDHTPTEPARARPRGHTHMRALRLHGNRDLRLDEVAAPDAGPGQLLIRVAWCGICGSDLHEYARGPTHVPHSAPHPLTGRTLPLALGHEFAGEVVVIGDDVDGHQVGDLATVNPLLADGSCTQCLAGRPNLCSSLGFIGISADGGFAELVAVPADAVRTLPRGMDARAGALIEPLAVALRGVRRAGVTPGKQVLVVGAGPIGLSVVLSLRAIGVTDVVVVEPTPARAEAARRLGADTVDPTAGATVRELMALTDGAGFDAVLESAGNEDALATAIRAVRPGGTLVSLAVWPGPANLSMPHVVFREVTVTGSQGYVDEFDQVLRMMGEGRLDPTPLVAATVPLARAVPDGFERLLSPDPGSGKILVQVDVS